MIQMHAEGPNIWKRRGKRGGRERIRERRRYSARLMGSSFCPRDSGNLGDLPNRNRAEDEAVRGRGSSSD